MLLLVKFLAKIFSVLNGEISPRQIAAGFAYGVVLGLIPAAGLMSVVLLFLGFLININLTSMFVAAGIFKLISFVVDPIANHLGFFVLTKIPSLVPFWTTLYNTPVVPFTKFNNTIVMGSFIVGLLLFIPMYFISKHFVVNYRTRWRETILRFKVVQVVRASSFYKYYLSYKDLTGS